MRINIIIVSKIFSMKVRSDEPVRLLFRVFDSRSKNHLLVLVYLLITSQ